LKKQVVWDNNSIPSCIVIAITTIKELQTPGKLDTDR